MGVDKRYRQDMSPGERVSSVVTETTGTNLKNFGVSLVPATTGAPNYTLDAPVAGAEKRIICNTGSSGNKTAVVLTNSTAVTFAASSGTSALRKLTFNAGNESVVLRGMSATQWFIETNTNSVAVATT